MKINKRESCIFFNLVFPRKPVISTNFSDHIKNRESFYLSIHGLWLDNEKINDKQKQYPMGP